jgi:hypothetical protein
VWSPSRVEVLTLLLRVSSAIQSQLYSFLGKPATEVNQWLDAFSCSYCFQSSRFRRTHPASQEPCTQDHEAWVIRTLEKMETIKPGMTREELNAVFQPQGGLSTALHRTFFSRDCIYFKVDVDFDAVGRPSRDENGRMTSVEDNRDNIVKISRP